MPLSYTKGFLRPTVVVSTGLYESLEREEVAAVLAHEEAHLHSRDNLLLLLAQTLAMTFVLVPGARLAFRRLRRAQELAADEYASARLGDSLVVASSLEKFARSLFRSARPALTVAFAEDGNVSERIEGLLFGRVAAASRRWAAFSLLVLGLLFGGFTASALAATEVSFAGGGSCSAAHESDGPAAATPPPHDCHRG
jgi:Zn-dependent protease with chaperone function